MLSLSRWENLRIEDHMDIATFFTKVYEIKRELQLAGHPQTAPVMVHRVLSRLPARFRHLVQQIRSERVMPTLEELHARLQMEEHFQVGERNQDPEEALVMRIRNVVRRRFSPQHPGQHFRPQGNSSYQVRSSTLQEFLCHRCQKPGHLARLCMAPASVPPSQGQANLHGRSLPLTSGNTFYGSHRTTRHGVNLLNSEPEGSYSPDLPSEELLEVAFEALSV